MSDAASCSKHSSLLVGSVLPAGMIAAGEVRHIGKAAACCQFRKPTDRVPVGQEKTTERTSGFGISPGRSSTRDEQGSGDPFERVFVRLPNIDQDDALLKTTRHFPGVRSRKDPHD